MKNKRITAVILAVVTITSCLFTQGVSAAKTSKTDITVFSGNTKQTLTAVESNSKIYFSAEDYSKITRYKYAENDTAVIYTLGEKSVSVNKSNKALTVGVPIQKTFEYSGAVTDGGTTYLPASEILPWLNVECYADGNTFVVKPDDITLWEVTEKIKNTRAEFNIINESNNYTATIAKIVLLTAVDGMLKLNPTRLMPCNDEIDTLYTIEAYRDTITDLATDDYFKSDEALKVVKKVGNINKVYKTVGELFPALNENTISDFLTSNYADNDTMMTFYNISDSLTTASALAEAAAATTDILKMWKLFEVAGRTQPDFLESVKLLYENSQQFSAIKLGAKKALSALTSNKKVAETISKDNKIPVSPAMALNVFDWGISYLMDKSQKKGLSVMLGDYGIVLKGIDAALSLAYPKGRKAISEAANLTIYDGIQRCAADYAKGLISATPDSQAVHEARIMLMLSLKASKKQYAALSLLNWISAKDTKEHNKAIANIDELLTELAYCESSELNDAVEDKTAKADEIAKLLSQINGEPHTAAETTSRKEEVDGIKINKTYMAYFGKTYKEISGKFGKLLSYNYIYGIGKFENSDVRFGFDVSGEEYVNWRDNHTPFPNGSKCVCITLPLKMLADNNTVSLAELNNSTNKDLTITEDTEWLDCFNIMFSFDDYSAVINLSADEMFDGLSCGMTQSQISNADDVILDGSCMVRVLQNTQTAEEPETTEAESTANGNQFSDNEQFNNYIKSNFHLADTSNFPYNLEDKDLLSAQIYDFNSDGHDELVVFYSSVITDQYDVTTYSINAAYYKIQNNTVSLVNDIEKITDIKGTGNWMRLFCSYLSDSKIMIENSCANFGGSVNLNNYMVVEVENNILAVSKDFCYVFNRGNETFTEKVSETQMQVDEFYNEIVRAGFEKSSENSSEYYGHRHSPFEPENLGGNHIFSFKAKNNNFFDSGSASSYDNTDVRKLFS